jgi:hypothetical protein
VKITSIKQQERLKGRYSIYVDEKYAFSLSADALLEERIVPGQELDEAQLKAYKKLSADDKAYGLALSYVVRRMRSEWELHDYFRRKGYDPELGEQIMVRLAKLGFDLSGEITDLADAFVVHGDDWLANEFEANLHGVLEPHEFFGVSQYVMVIDYKALRNIVADILVEQYELFVVKAVSTVEPFDLQIIRVNNGLDGNCNLLAGP